MHGPHSPNQSISLKHFPVPSLIVNKRSSTIGASVSMDQSKAAGANHQASRTYEDFEPFCKLHDRDNVIEIHVQGFRKEHLSVRTTHTGMLTIHGERPLDQARSKWSRFHKELKLPNNCDANRVAAKFTAGVLTVTMPPKIVATQEDIDRNSLLPLPTSHVDNNQTNNDKSLGELMKQNDENDKTNNGENAALLGGEVKEGSNCGFRQRGYLASKKQIAVKIVMVVAAVVGFGVAAYVLYKHGRGFYSSPEIEESFC